LALHRSGREEVARVLSNVASWPPEEGSGLMFRRLRKANELIQKSSEIISAAEKLRETFEDVHNALMEQSKKLHAEAKRLMGDE
jgi:RNA polymerase-interacting CarD/CdnL/TRCF family regulator